ncbi:STN domain-containing protein [Pandoraea apista]|uniref:STN domain-containing protein n=1 Tax=Pandoraea apista TaxID=93218 RepID=UPI0039C33E64
MSVFYPSSLVEGRRSHAVSGLYSPREALDELLEGTGVTAEATAQSAFVLAPLGTADTQRDVARSAARAANDYHARLQAKVLQALCAAPSQSVARCPSHIRADAVPCDGRACGISFCALAAVAYRRGGARRNAA